MPARHAICLFAALALLSTRAAATEIHCDGQEANLKAYLEMFDKVFNGRDLSLVEKYVSPAFKSRYAPPSAPTGPELTKGFVAATAKAFPKRKLTNDVIVCKDDLLIASQTIEAVNDGPYMGQPPTGKAMKFTGIDIYRYKDGMMVEQWGDYDVLGMMKQMGYTLTAPGGQAVGPSSDAAARAANRAPAK
jgi:predicted SnoaL-like aldol condensation-catalyzing enzyme